MLLGWRELDCHLDIAIVDIGEEVRLAARHDEAFARSDNMLLALDDNLDLPRSDVELLFSVGMDVKECVAPASAALLKNHIEPGDCRVVDRPGEYERFPIESIVKPHPALDSDRHHRISRGTPLVTFVVGKTRALFNVGFGSCLRDNALARSATVRDPVNVV